MKRLLPILCWLLIAASTEVSADWYSHEENIFGTAFAMQFWAEEQQQADLAIQRVVDEMWRLHHSLSPFESESDLSYINQMAADHVVEISPEMAMLLDKALYFSRISSGAFDPSFASVGQKYDYRAGVAPSEEELEQLTPAIDYRQIDLDIADRTIHFLQPHMSLDLGGLAKGYAMDRAVLILQEMGIDHASVSAGGDMRLIGDRRDRPWIIGIRNPRTEETAIRLPLENTAVSTSGDYERFFIDDSGERVHHILDPQTGRSAAKVASVTILGEVGLNTDPLSTTVFVLGVDKGLELVESLPGFDAIIIDIKGQVFYSSGLMPPQ